MYADASSLFLARKWKIFETWKLVKRREYKKQNYPSKVGWYPRTGLGKTVASTG